MVWRDTPQGNVLFLLLWNHAVNSLLKVPVYTSNDDIAIVESQICPQMLSDKLNLALSIVGVGISDFGLSTKPIRFFSLRDIRFRPSLFLAHAGPHYRWVLRLNIFDWSSIPSSTGGRMWLLGYARWSVLLTAAVELSEPDEVFVQGSYAGSILRLSNPTSCIVLLSDELLWTVYNTLGFLTISEALGPFI